ncbi:MAG: hypothetical protein AABY05_01320, partial [Nanoarchaeota archaeon]
YADVGAKMLNGKTQKEKMCFYGIVESDYWTPQGKALFNECLGFATSQCNVDADCPADSFTGNRFCQDNDVYQNKLDYSCVSTNAVKQCLSSNNSVKIEECPFGCSNGVCLGGRHDVGFIDFSGSFNGIKIETENGTDILQTDNLLCNSKYQISLTMKNKGDHVENVTFNGSVDGISIVHNDVRNFVVNDTALRTRTINFSLPEGDYQIRLNALLDGDDNPSDNQVTRGVFVSCPFINCRNDNDCNDMNQTTQDICVNPGTKDSFCRHDTIRCFVNSDCGTDGFIQDAFCSFNNTKDVLRRFESFTCLNPRTRDASCRSDISNRVLQTCSQLCTNGTCGGIRCNQDSECNDNNPLTNDRCINPGTVVSECRNTVINCASNLDCGSTGFIGTELCSGNNVSKNFQTALCKNSGSKESFCEINVEQRNLDMCDFACFQGTCIRCDSNADCNDNNSNTKDTCVNPGTRESSCKNDPKDLGDVFCSSDSDCGSSTVLSAPFCSVKDVNQLVLRWHCNNPSTTTSYCSSMVDKQFVRTCSQFCTNGQCIDIRCTTNNDCNDNNSNTLDVCNNPGTDGSFCTNNPMGVICRGNSDCGLDGFIGNNICLGNSVTKLYQTFTCFAPNTPFSFCSSSLSQKVVEQCSFTCSSGQCITETGECTPGQTRQCGLSDVGECKLGTQTCEQNRFFGSCVGAVNSVTEICTDGKDNDCDGLTDSADSNCVVQCIPHTEICNNIDDDCDQQIDEGLQCNPQPGPRQCDDGIDNDQDSFIDYPADPGCDSRQDDSELPVNNVVKKCSDGIDNDQDGFIDYPADPGCQSRQDDSELPVNSTPSVPGSVECSDGFDNDRDGKIDYPADPQCVSRTDDKEIS